MVMVVCVKIWMCLHSLCTWEITGLPNIFKIHKQSLECHWGFNARQLLQVIRKPLLFQANNGLSCCGEWIPPALYVTHQIFGFLGLRVIGYQVPMVMDSDSTCWLLMIMGMASSVIIALVTLEDSSCKMMCNTTRSWKKKQRNMFTQGP